MAKYTIDDKEVTLTELVSHLSGQGDSAEFVPKARLAKEREARKALEERLADAEEAGGNVAKLQKQIEALSSENEGLKVGSVLAAKGITDAKVQRQVKAIYTADTADAEKPPTLAEWLDGEGAKNPMIRAALPQGQPQTPAARAPGIVDPNGGNPPNGTPKAGAPRTAEQLAQYFASAEWKTKLATMKPEERLAELARLEAESAPQNVVTP